MGHRDLAYNDLLRFRRLGTAGMMSAMFLVLGIFTGCLFSLLVGKMMLVDSGAIVRDVISVAANVTRKGCP